METALTVLAYAGAAYLLIPVALIALFLVLTIIVFAFEALRK